MPSSTVTSAGVTSPKPLWKTVVSVIIKNFALLVVLLLLVQLIRTHKGSGLDSILISNSDYETQIAEVVAFLKTTTKMMQFQVDVVDRKLDNEIAGLKTEFTKRIDDKGADFSSSFTILDGRVKSMEKSLTSDWLSKDEFNKFLEELKSKLDEVKEIVEKHAADGVGRVDYAVASGGGTVSKHSEPFIRANRLSRWISGLCRWIAGNVHSDAVKMLKPSFGRPGECFPLKGDNGFVEIKLRTAIIPEAITIEYLSKSVAFDRSSAPKHCKVFGWLGHKKGKQEKKHLLTELTYDLEKSNAQTFKVVDKKSTLMDTIRLEFVSNHGSPSHTCIYRVRVHGHEPNLIS